MSRAKGRFSLKAYNRWEVHLYKGKPRVIMNRHPFVIRQKITPMDVLSPSRVRELIAWLNRYLNEVEPTNQSLAVAGIRANNNGIQRNLIQLESSL